MAELTELIYSASSGTPGVVSVGQGISLWQSQSNLSCHGAEPLNYLRLLVQQIFTVKVPTTVPGVWRVIVCLTVLTRKIILRSIQSNALKHNKIG